MEGNWCIRLESTIKCFNYYFSYNIANKLNSITTAIITRTTMAADNDAKE